MKRAGHCQRANSGREAAAAPAFTVPERLVGLGFRYWLDGYRTGDISRWEKVWCTYSSVMGAAVAKSAVGDLACWVRTINNHTQRDLRTSAVDCGQFCRDECVAISMIAACQHQVCPAMRACAFALLGCSMIDEVVQVAESFAETMRDADQMLSASHAYRLPLLARMPAATAMRQ